MMGKRWSIASVLGESSRVGAEMKCCTASGACLAGWLAARTDYLASRVHEAPYSSACDGGSNESARWGRSNVGGPV
jgi:hypothetical protein